ncbi:nucleic-acid-binding protein from mobile element jockey [Plakobranchus ocellatus]|uniref:Nucleic-acid-binding protein from mobile element jockey n=1 Tax=Plakobranchus ocellatus TaxID=259542 RepID=A0AAV3YCM3_9GAST|nr:nucleic-acid-binding protein from mobile element jockey [Plakobranchus ocellatus]
MVISSKGSSKVVNRSPFKIYRKLKSILSDETIECQCYGHGKDRCKKTASVCVRCGKDGHIECDCLADLHCVNCRGDHAASSKTCPKFQEEQATFRYKAENGGTFQQARKAVVVEIRKTISTRTHASAVKTQLRTKLAAEIGLKSGLHAAVAIISLEKTLTVCSLNLPPNSPVTNLSLPELFEQLPRSFLVLGDFNAHEEEDSREVHG